MEAQTNPFEAALARSPSGCALQVRSTCIPFSNETLERVHLAPSSLDVLAERIRTPPDLRRADRKRLKAALRWTDDDVCPVPGHSGYAYFGLVRETGNLALKCSCLGTDVETFPGKRWTTTPWTSLADVYRAVWTGQPLAPMPKGERWSWTLLLAHEVGLMEPVPVRLTPLPDDAADLERQIRSHAQLMFGLRLAAGSDLEMPLPVRFLLDILRLEPKMKPRVNEALQKLRTDRGVLKLSRGVPSRVPGRLPLYLYEPGDRPEA